MQLRSKERQKQISGVICPAAYLGPPTENFRFSSVGARSELSAVPTNPSSTLILYVQAPLPAKMITGG